MTKYLLAVVAVMGLATVGCGGNACEEQSDRINDKIEGCEGTVPAKQDNAEDAAGDTECSDTNEADAKKAADAFVALSCEEILVLFPKK